ncbi:MAG: DUF1559 domain-containing protein [Planctomycetota bacterium]|nr:MAG: DUF1559 domain-containing protein [Planctomycetota bacterium]
MIVKGRHVALIELTAMKPTLENILKNLIDRRTAKTRGITMIELLVIISIISMIALIIIPGIQASRESARKAQCVNQLKQFGVAIAQFETTNREFPASITSSDTTAWKRVGFQSMSVHMQILPYLEQKPLYDSVNLNPHPNSRFLAFASLSNFTALQTRVGTFLCPSDRFKKLPGNSYRANVGPNPDLLELQHVSEPKGGGGALRPLYPTKASEFTDGLSKTVGLSERVAGSNEISFSKDRDLWFTGLEKSRGLVSNDELVEICGIPNPNPSEFYAALGTYWLPGRYADTVYNHVGTPNAPFPDCVMHEKLYEGRPPLNTAAVTARSRHNGGVQVLLMDGSVSFVKNSITYSIWRAISTRSGNERLGEY